MTDLLSREELEGLLKIYRKPHKVNRWVATIEALNDALVLSERARDLGDFGSRSPAEIIKASNAADAAVAKVKAAGWVSDE